MVPEQPLTLPTTEQLESWAGRGRVVRATPAEVAGWRLPQPAKDALVFIGVPLVDELIHKISFRTVPTMYRLALDYDDGPVTLAWEYSAVPDTGEVRRGPADGSGNSAFVNSSVGHWLCSLHMVGSWLSTSTVVGHWDESEAAEEQALAELAGLLRRIEVIDPAAIADGDHERQFWPGALDRWLY